jgi:hypothetical protein
MFGPSLHNHESSLRLEAASARLHVDVLEICVWMQAQGLSARTTLFKVYSRPMTMTTRVIVSRCHKESDRRMLRFCLVPNGHCLLANMHARQRLAQKTR